MIRLSRGVRIAALVGILALAFSLIGILREGERFFRSYLFSFLFWSDLPLGALALVMIHALTGGRWGGRTHGILEALSDTMAAVAVFSVPILLGLKWIYPWMDPKIASGLHQAHYLNPTGFIIRTVVYFGCWLALNVSFQRHSGSPEKLGKLSAGGLIFLGFLATFASIDWQMSVEPTWYSTIYGLVFIVGQALSAFAFALVIFGMRASGSGDEIPQQTLRDLGNLLLALVMVWAYLSFMQYLIVWSGNLPHEVIWYQHRTQGGWKWLALVLALFQFAAPFILLLFRASKNSPARLAYLGGMIFAVRVVDHYWMLMPGFAPQGFELPWQAITLWVGLGGIWGAVFLKRLGGRASHA